jgi:hypothetical protein
MDYFQGVVTEFLRADRAVFVNTECCIQLNPGENPDRTGPHWFCDAVAVNFRERRVYLCEITYSKSLSALNKRLADWAADWGLLQVALVRDCHVPGVWPVQPWLFVPHALQMPLKEKLARISSIGMGSDRMPIPRTTDLEEVAPWKYRSWDRHESALEADKQED